MTEVFISDLKPNEDTIRVEAIPVPGKSVVHEGPFIGVAPTQDALFILVHASSDGIIAVDLKTVIKLFRHRPQWEQIDHTRFRSPQEQFENLASKLDEISPTIQYGEVDEDEDEDWPFPAGTPRGSDHP